MKVLCDKCGYELEIEDNLLLEGNIDFSCPNCQHGIKVGEKVSYTSGEKEEYSDLLKTDVFPSKLMGGLEEDETVIKRGEQEITIDRIAKEISKPSPTKINQEISSPSIVSKTPSETELSELSKIRSSKTATENESDVQALFKRKFTLKPADLKDKATPTADGIPKNYPESSFHEKTEVSEIKLIEDVRTSIFRSLLKNLAKKKNIIIYIPLLLLVIIFFLYPFLTVKRGNLKVQSPVIDPSISEINNITSKVSLYYAFDSVDALMHAGKLLLDALKKYPQNIKLKAGLAKLYADLGMAIFNQEMLHKALELSIDILTLHPYEPDALKSLAIYYWDDPEKSANFLNRTFEARVRLGLPQHDQETYYIEANIELNLGNYDKALERLNQALSINPDFIRACRVIRQIYILKEEPDKVKVMDSKLGSLEEKYFNTLPELKSKTPETMPTPLPAIQPRQAEKPPKEKQPRKVALWDIKFRKAQDLFLKSKYLEAEQELTGAISIYKKSYSKKAKSKTLSDIYNLLGHVYLKLYKTDSALNSFKDAIRNNFVNSDAHKGLGSIYEDLGEKKQAALEYKHYLKYNPSAWDTDTITEKIINLEKKK